MRHYLPIRLTKLLVTLLLATLASLGLLVSLTLALDFPPGGSVAVIQTSGPNTGLNIGDWYTNAGQGNRPHQLQIFVPCTVPPGQNFTLELLDPEVFTGTLVTDEIRGAGPDDATFTLVAPDGVTTVASQTYLPTAATNDQFVTLAVFNQNTFGCGTYMLLVQTSDDDDNGWTLRVTPDDPDGAPGSGDELQLASFETSFQHINPGCQAFFFFVPVTTSINLNNFDMDSPALDPNASITYIPPAGAPVNGSVSGSTIWNNGGGAGHPPPGGDVINNPTAGWWQVQTCTITDNQYIFEPEGLAYYLQQPPVPQMAVAKDDGITLIAAGQVTTYTLIFTNTGDGAALNATLTDPLPALTTFVGCTGGQSCGETSPGVVTFDLGIVPANFVGQVTLSIQLDVNFPPNSLLTNTVQLNYTDTMGNIYPPAEATDINQTPAVVGPDLTLSKTDNGVTTAPGAVVPYILNYANVSPTGATGVVITDPVPANATFNAAGSLPTVWSCPDGSPAGTICTTTIGPVPGNSSGSVVFALKVNNPLPSGVTSISNSAAIGDDGANGPDPTPGNNVATENTPVNPPQSPPDSGSGGGNGNGSKDSSPPPPPAAPPPAPAAPVMPPEPTPVLPVLLLPETGLRTTQTTSLGAVLPVLTAVGLILTLLSFWAKSRRKK